MDDGKNIEQLNREKASVARLSILSNLGLVIIKLATGILIGSISIISEAIHSGIDLVASTIAYISIKKSSEPPDLEHAFGHGKFENISGFIEALLIFAAAIIIIKEAYDKLVYGIVLEDVSIGIVVMLISAIANFIISEKLRRTAKRTDSIALEADAWHLRTDVLSSACIFLGLVAIKITGIKVLDPIMAIAVALFILFAALRLTVKSVRDLMDIKLPEEEEREIRRIIEKYSDEFIDYHDLRTRKAGSDRFVDLHLVVPKKLSVEAAHALTDTIEDEIARKYPRTSVIIHVEPCEVSGSCDVCDDECKKYGP